MKKPAPFPLRLDAAALFLAFCTLATAQTWVGGGETRNWNDKENWAEKRLPITGKGATITFADADGASFAFGGNAPLRFGALITSTNAGPVSMKGPAFHLGGSSNEEPDVGFILEEILFPAVINNQSASPFTLTAADIRADGDIRITAASNSVVTLVGDSSFGGRLTTDGHVRFKDGDVRANRFAIVNGLFELDNATFALTNNTVGTPNNRPDIAFRFVNGSRFEITREDRTGALSFLAPLEVENASIVAKVDHFHFTQNPPVFGPGTTLDVDGALRFPIAGSLTNRQVVTFGPGSKIRASRFVLGGNQRRPWPARNDRLCGVDVVIHGEDPAKKASPASPATTRLEVFGNHLRVGGDDDNNNSYGMRLFADGDVRIDVAEGIDVPDAPGGSPFNALVLSNGVHATCKRLFFGNSSESNTLIVSRSKLEVLDGRFAVGNPGQWNRPGSRNNRVVIRDGSEFGSFKMGFVLARSADANDKPERSNATNNIVQVLGGSTFRSEWATIGEGSLSYPTADNQMILSGKGTRWLFAENANLNVGFGNNGRAVGNTLLIQNGAALRGVRDLKVGNVADRGGRATGNRLIVRGGSIESTGDIFVGTIGNARKNAVSETNLVVIAVHNNIPSSWDFHGGALLIGYGNGTERVRGNIFRGGPGAKLTNLSRISVGGSRNADSYHNLLELSGCEISPIETLTVYANNTISIAVSPAFAPHGTHPLLVTGNVSFDYDTFIRPEAARGTKPGKYPVLLWKGEAKDIDKLKLSPDVNSKRWNLIVDTEKKQVLVELLW